MNISKISYRYITSDFLFLLLFYNPSFFMVHPLLSLFLTEQAMKEAKDDQIRLQQQTREEGSSVTMETLNDIHV